MVKNHQPTEHDAIAKTIVGHAPRTGANAPRHRAASNAGPIGTGEIADMAVMGEGRGDREEGCPEGPRLRLEPRRVWYRDVADADKVTEVSWLRQNVMGPVDFDPRRAPFA